MNKDFGNLFYDSSDGTLILNILRDLSEHMGHSLENPLSLYLVCLDLLMPVEVCDSIYIEILTVFKSEEREKLSDYKYVKKIMIKHFPAAKNFNELSVKAYMKGLAKSRFPELTTMIE